LGQPHIASLFGTDSFQDPSKWWNPHFDFFVIDRDLTSVSENMNFIFWQSLFPVNVISTKRFTEYIKEKTERLMVLKIVWAHEFCHNLSLVKRNENCYNATNTSNVVDKWHCMWQSWPCLMEQYHSGRKTVSQIASQIIDRVNWLCHDCTEEIRYKKDIFRQNWFYW